MVRLIETLVIALMIALLVFAIDTAYSTPDAVDYDTYIVCDGDTLWEIAKLSNGYGHIDIRDIIDDIEDASDCTAYIKDGDIIQIPMYDF